MLRSTRKRKRKEKYDKIDNQNNTQDKTIKNNDHVILHFCLQTVICGLICFLIPIFSMQTESMNSRIKQMVSGSFTFVIVFIILALIIADIFLLFDTVNSDDTNNKSKSRRGLGKLIFSSCSYCISSFIASAISICCYVNKNTFGVNYFTFVLFICISILFVLVLWIYRLHKNKYTLSALAISPFIILPLAFLCTVGATNGLNFIYRIFNI